MYKIYLFAAAAIVTMMASDIHRSSADLIYRFRGTLPEGSTNHEMVSDGESYVGTFFIDRSPQDSDPHPGGGNYAGAVISGQLKFSGGYVSPFTFNNIDVRVNDNLFSQNSGPYDSIIVRDLTNQTLAIQSITTVTSTLGGDHMPGVGKTITPFPSQTITQAALLLYTDNLGTIEHRGHIANNVYFNAIPEPSSGLLSIMGLSAIVIGRRWRRRR